MYISINANEYYKINKQKVHYMQYFLKIYLTSICLERQKWSYCHCAVLQTS